MNNGMTFKKIGVIVADRDEYIPLSNCISGAEELKTPFAAAVKFNCGGAEVAAVLCGIGKVNAASAAMYLACGGCDLILNYGLSGGIAG
ncbi:MAG: hypothetical protein IK086_06430, partial [Clostridia bacterium]|nr:hypothetical protein [Clostridia bacterium]